MAAAAEKRIAAAVRVLPSSLPPGKKSGELGRREELRSKSVNLSKELSAEEANQLFAMVFGIEVSKGILAQWSNQGIRYFIISNYLLMYLKCMDMSSRVGLADTNL